VLTGRTSGTDGEGPAECRPDPFKTPEGLPVGVVALCTFGIEALTGVEPLGWPLVMAAAGGAVAAAASWASVPPESLPAPFVGTGALGSVAAPAAPPTLTGVGDTGEDPSTARTSQTPHVLHNSSFPCC
jgi:hypothetical protein